MTDTYKKTIQTFPETDPTGTMQARQTLRMQAETLARQKTPTSSAEIAAMTPETIQQMLHELLVHRIELEMQNEELRRAHTELDASRKRYFDLYDLAPAGYLTIAENGQIKEANLTAATLLGTPRSTLIGQPLSRFIFKEDQDVYYLYRKKLDTCTPRMCELRMVKPDSTFFWAHLVINGMYLADDTPVCLLVLSDITEHKQLETALRESEIRFRRLLRDVPAVAVQGYGPDGTTQYWNFASEQLYGYSSEEAIGRNLLELIIPPEMRGEVAQAIQQMATTGQPTPAAELSLMRKDGSRVTVFSSHTIVQLPGQQPELFCIDIDITERKQMEAIMAARLRLLEATRTDTFSDLLQTSLDEAEAITGSQIGFYHFMEPDQDTLSFQAWSTNTLKGACKAKDRGRHYSISQAGVWGDCIRNRKPVIHNDYAALPYRKGLPEGHIPIVRELVIPILRENNIVAIIGVGNKPTDYTERDVAALTSLADIAWEIVEHNRAEEALRESEERYRLIFESASDAVYLIDPDTTQIIKASNRATELYGYGQEEFLSKKSSDLSAEPEKTPSLSQEALQNSVGTIINIPMCMHRKKNGTLFPVELTARLLPLQGKHVLFVAARDISKRKQNEEALRQSEERRLLAQETANAKLKEQADSLSTIYEVLDSIGLIVCELEENDCRIQIFNSGAKKLFGYQQNEAIGESIALIYPPESLNLIPGRVKKFIQGKAMHSFDMTLKRKSNERFHAVVSVHPFDAHDGQFRKVVGVFRDITELFQAQEALKATNATLEQRVEQRTLELQETQKQYLHAEKLSAIGKLSASIAHEFNNPLQGILSILKGLKKRAVLEQEDRELLDAAISESDRIKNLIRSLQEFNRPSSGRKVVMDVHKSLDAMLLLHKSDFKNKRISLELKYAEHLPHILAIPDQIKQVFLNLLTNAADACQDHGGVITVNTWQEDDKVAVAIQDTGIGIKPEEMAYIFQPFYTTKQAVKGTGLGLSVSHGIINQHQGEIRVESRPGEGSTFTVLLPIK